MAGGSYPINTHGRNQSRIARRLHRNALEVLRLAPDLSQQAPQLLFDLPRRHLAPDGPLGACDRLAQALLVERFEEVIDRVDLERAEGVLVVGRYENHRRHRLHADGLDDLEAADFGHLHVEEDQVRPESADGLDRLAAVGALGDDLDLRVVEQNLDALPRQLHVVNDDRPDTHLTLAVSSRKGSSMLTTVPSPGRAATSKWCAAP